MVVMDASCFAWWTNSARPSPFEGDFLMLPFTSQTDAVNWASKNVHVDSVFGPGEFSCLLVAFGLVRLSPVAVAASTGVLATRETFYVDDGWTRLFLYCFLVHRVRRSPPNRRSSWKTDT